MIDQQIGQYRILSKIGQGGMGVVYKAEDCKLGRTVALKFLPAEFLHDPLARKRLLREAQAASNLEHVNICTIHDIVETPEGQTFIVMAYYDGMDLKQKAQSQPLPVQEILNFGLQMALGLQVAHDKGIIHQDIKSSNIMITQSGHLKIMDFGIARQLERTSSLSSPDTTYGTLAYMSPEQTRGEKLDWRTDIWSFGAVMYELTTGQLPFRANYDQALIYSILYQEPAPPHTLNPQIPATLSDLIMKCLQKKTMDRYQSMEEIVKELLEISYEKGRLATFRKIRLRQLIIASAFSLALLAALVGGGIIYREAKRVHGTLLVEVRELSQNQVNRDPQLAAMVHYLVANELDRSGRKYYTATKKFHAFYPGKIPDVTLNIDAETNSIGYTIRIRREEPLLWNWMRPVQRDFHVNDYAVLLTETIPAINKQMLSYQQPPRYATSLTRHWDSFVWFYRGDQAWKKLDITAAKEALSAAIQIDPDFVLARLLLARVYKFEASYKMARQVMLSIRDRFQILSPIDSLRCQALISWLEGNARHEIDLLRRIYEASPLDPENAFEVAEAYYNIGEIHEAMRFYNLVLHQDSTFSRAYNHLGYCYSSLGEHDQALWHFRRYLELDSTANAYDSLGDGYLNAGRLDSAAEAKERGIQCDQKLCYLYSQLFFIRLLQGRLQEAGRTADLYQDFAVSQDEMIRGLYLQATLQYYHRNYSAALRYCQEALAISDVQDVTTRYHELHWLFAMICLELQRDREAMVEMQVMDRIVSDNQISAHNYRHYIYKYWRNLQAIFAAREGDVDRLLEIGRELDRVPEKIKDLQTIYDYPYFCLDLARLLSSEKIGRHDLAMERMQLALKSSPWNGFVHRALWQAYRQQGNHELAEKHHQIAREIWRDADEAWKRLYL